MASFGIGMLEQHGDSPADEDARERLASALPQGAQVGAADAETGAFTVTVEADDLDAALTIVWDAVAASGTDDHLLFLEHADLPEHWRARSGKPGGDGLPGSIG
jgi:hypothetical protein